MSTPIVTLSVPAGTYAVTGAAVVDNSDKDPHYANCSINGGHKFGAHVDGRNGGNVVTIPVLGTFVGPGTITLGCPNFDMISSSEIQAVKVG